MRDDPGLAGGVDHFALVESLADLEATLVDLEAATTSRPWLVVALVLVGSYLLVRFVRWASTRHLEHLDLEAAVRSRR